MKYQQEWEVRLHKHVFRIFLIIWGRWVRYRGRAAIIRWLIDEMIKVRLYLLNCFVYFELFLTLLCKNYKNFHFYVSYQISFAVLPCHNIHYIKLNLTVPRRNKNLAILFMSEQKLSVQGFCLLKSTFFCFHCRQVLPHSGNCWASATYVTQCVVDLLYWALAWRGRVLLL